MIVQCENCQTKFNVNPDRIKDTGSNVRCANCKHVFKIFKPGTAPAPQGIPASPPVTPSPPQFAAPAAASAVAPDSTPVSKKAQDPVKEFPATDSSLDDWDSEMDFGDLDDHSSGEEAFGQDQPAELSAKDTEDDFGIGDLDAESSDGGFDFGDLDEIPDFSAMPDTETAPPSMDDLTGDDAGGRFDFGDLDSDLDLPAPVEKDGGSPAMDDLGNEDIGGFDFGDLDGDLDLGAPMKNGDDLSMDDLGGDDSGGVFDFGDLDGDMDGDLDLGAPMKNGADLSMDDLGGDDAGGGFDFGDLDSDLELGPPSPGESKTDANHFDMDFGDTGDDSGGKMDFGDFDDLTIGEPVVAPPEETLGIASVSDDDELDFGNLGDDFDLGEPDTLVEDHKPAMNQPDEGGGLDDLDLKAAGDDFAGFAGEEVPEDDDELDFGNQFSDLGPDVDLGSTSSKDPFAELQMSNGAGMEMDDISPLDDISPAGEDEDLVFFEGDEEEAVAGKIKAPSVGKKRKLPWILAGFCGVLALFAALFFLYPTLLNPLLKPLGLSTDAYDPAKDPDGSRYLSIDKTTHYFGTNQYIGNILVITGVVVNQYPQPRSYIRVKGMLHSKAGENLLGAKQVYGGNWLSGEELQTLPYNEIMERLRQKSGQNNTNQDIQPGDSVKYMIVFDQIPESLGSYTVEALGSDPSDQSK